MLPWNCCRTCASVESLHPIFLLPEHSEKYTNAVFLTTGVKVALNDSYPQEMCSACIAFINESIRFRRKCEDVQRQLQDNAIDGIKIETSTLLKTEENATTIYIGDALDEDFKDYDDNITLDTLQYNEITIKHDDKLIGNCNQTRDEEFEGRVIEIDEKPIDIMFDSKKRKSKSARVKKREGKEKSQRVREEIECEYCHKILTSKLSLRNHYKIHTGFDVVCEHCGKKFITRRLLLMHCRAKHGYEKTDKCSYCDYKASNAEQVKIHERLHTGEKPFVCASCGAGFHRKSSYLQHVAIHLPEKTVQCDQCPARFKSVTLMRIHKNRHRPPQYTFKCGVCENSFARRRNVARHLQRVHGLAHDGRIHRVKMH